MYDESSRCSVLLSRQDHGFDRSKRVADTLGYLYVDAVNFSNRIISVFGFSDFLRTEVPLQVVHTANRRSCALL